jgi:hypothetical protein
MIASYPAVYQNRDTIRFLRVFPTGLFDDYWLPAGYPALIGALHFFSDRVAVLTALQHLLGLATGLIGYLFVRRAGCSGLVGLLAALPVFVGGEFVFLEQTIAAETLFAFLIAAAAYLALLDSPSALAAGSAVFGLAATVRSSALVLPLVLALWVVLVGPRRRVLFALAPAIAIVIGYAALASTTGRYTGLTDMSGWNLYARTAPFADCSRFRPPRELAVLCQRQTARPGPYFYLYGPGDPALSHFSVPGALYGLFALDERENAEARRFADGAITHQPFDYLREVSVDAARYVAPSVRTRPWSGSGPSYYSFGGVNRWEDQRWLESVVAKKYEDAKVRRSPSVSSFLAQYQSVARLNGVLVVLALVAAVAGLSEARLRRAILLPLGLALALLLVPVLTLSWDYRYGLPAQIFLTWAGALGGAGLAVRYKHRVAAILKARPTR